MRWAAFDMKEFKELIRRFSGLNDAISDLLYSRPQRDIARTTQDIYREVLQMATQQDQLRGIIDAAGFGQQIHGSQERGLRTLMELASFKAFHRSVDEREPRRFQDMGDKSKRVKENPGPTMVIHVE